jgi:hypothetical protein
MSKGSAPLAELNELHSLLAKEFKSQLNNGLEVVTKEGQVVKVSCGASQLNVIRQFLRDNNVECNGSLNPDIKSLTEELPFDELKQEPVRPH